MHIILKTVGIMLALFAALAATYFFSVKIPKPMDAQLRGSGGDIKDPYIAPKDFSVGLMGIGPDYHTANLCNPKILYPVNQPGVEYGSKVPEDCPAARFVRSP